MDAPAFFGWLIRKYPSVIVDCIEVKPVDVHGVLVMADSSQPNPNGVEFDNLYLDMNGIIHSCIHPDGKPDPTDEDEMMKAILEYINRVFRIVRPRKFLYMAIDGVAPKAKMNQQRSRHFRASKGTFDKTLASKGKPPGNSKESHFDSNCITPGTPFMARLSASLHCYIHDRMNNDPGWKGIKVMLSDSNVPGEGKQKIMDYIRKQRAQPHRDPSTRHVLCGADADLIMLGLATHESNFTIIREEFKPDNLKPCDICGQMVHDMKGCVGAEPNQTLEENAVGAECQFIFVSLTVLREYLKRELVMPNLPFKYDFERTIDDWVFLCLFVGNDCLPRLLSLEIRENAIDRLVNLYKKTVCKTGKFLTDSGDINLYRLQLIMSDLADMEDEIFKQRQRDQEDGQAHDEVRLWENGFKDRYYESKFDENPDDFFINTLALQYVRGLCWVLRYYSQGCASWKWCFPYHYAPFVSDFINIGGLSTEFEENTIPFRPLEQLMAVLPAASSSHVPASWRKLMSQPWSPIIDFYPKDFKIDLNGKKFAWQGVALLSFVEESRLFKALEPYYSDLTEAETKRNVRGDDRLYIGPENSSFDLVKSLYENKVNFNVENVVCVDGMKGRVLLTEGCAGEGKIVCIRIRDPKYDDDYIFFARKLEDTKEPPRVLKPQNLEQMNRIKRDNDGSNQTGFVPLNKVLVPSIQGAQQPHMPMYRHPPPSKLNGNQIRHQTVYSSYNQGGYNSHENTSISGGPRANWYAPPTFDHQSRPAPYNLNQRGGSHVYHKHQNSQGKTFQNQRGGHHGYHMHQNSQGKTFQNQRGGYVYRYGRGGRGHNGW